jgi:hypothetical protein
MENLKKIHRDIEEIDFSKLWEEGVFVFDSNVLLDLYRLPKSARNDLINVIENEKFADRVWIGFQVVLEFLNNRFEAISDQKNKFTSVRNILENAIEQYDELTSNLETELAKLKLRQRHSLIEPDKFINQKNIDSGIKYIQRFIDNLDKLEKKQSDVNDLDQIKEIVLRLFEGRMGNGFDKKRLEGIYKEGEKRYENKIPPGYKDIKKVGSHLFEDKEYIRKYGDLILWYEIIEKAKEDNLEYIILVTGDVKEDWWYEKRGKKLGPRKELLNEIYFKVPDLDVFHMYDTSTFLKYAKQQLKIDIKDSSISEAKDIIELSRQSRIEVEKGFVYIPDALKNAVNNIEAVRIGIGKSVYNLPPLKIDMASLKVALFEILSNVRSHSQNGYAGVQAKHDMEGYIKLRFKNPKKKENQGEITENWRIRARGIENIKAILSSDNIDVRIEEDPKKFTIELIIPKITVPNNA